MAREVVWTAQRYEEFVRMGLLTDEESAILHDHVVKDSSRVEMAMRHNMSVSKVDKILARLKAKYDVCQQYSSILPPRKK